MKSRMLPLLVLVFSISALGVYFYVGAQSESGFATFQINTYVIFQVDENGNADAEWIYEIPPSALADQVRLSIVGGTMGDVPVHGMGVENAKLVFLSDVQSSYAKYGLGMKNVSCDIRGLNEEETLKIVMQWRTPYFARRRENLWEILFQPVDNKSYAQETINNIKSLQSTISVVAKDSQLNLTSKTSIILPTGASISNENEILGFGTQSLDYGGGTTETDITYIQEIEGRPAVVSESQAVVTPQLITITEEEFLEASRFIQIYYTNIPLVYGFDGSASCVANDMKFGRERGEYTVSIDGQEFNITPYQLLYYSAKRVVSLAENNTEPLLSGIQPISTLPPDNESGDWNAIFKTLTRDGYVALAQDIRDQIASAGKAPSEINSSIGTIRSRDVLFTFLKVISFYYEHGNLPDNVTFAPVPTGNLVRDGVEIPANNAYFLLNTQHAITDTPRVSQIVRDFQELGYDDNVFAEEVNRWVYENIMYKLILGFFTSEEVLDAGEGKCLDKAHLYLALMRTADIPAKRVDGFLIYDQVTYPFVQIAGVTPDGRYIVGHSWTEVYIPSEGWVFADPTANQFRISTYSGNLYSSVEQTWQEVLASYETTYGELI
ncbi:MAG TPA: transglutaminase family protein [Hadesarchaea archaeon]|nr:transglutaminase family protein [Hadesarchaea archaeon]